MARLRTLILGAYRPRLWKIKNGVLVLWQHPFGSAAEIPALDIHDPGRVADCLAGARTRYRGDINEAIREFELIQQRWGGSC